MQVVDWETGSDTVAVEQTGDIRFMDRDRSGDMYLEYGGIWEVGFEFWGWCGAR